MSVAGRSGKRDRRGVAGQSIVLAVLVMFLLMFLGGIFIAVLRRNIARTTHHTETLNAQQLAEAGLEYVNSQLSSGAEGADWRPEPEYPLNTSGNGCSDAPTTLNITDQDAQDPDFRWLRPYAPVDSGKVFTFDDTRAQPQIIGSTRVYPKISVSERGGTGGFSRVSYGGGRFLVRVTYNPNNDPSVGPIMSDATPNTPSPLSKFIMIESIGREGIVDRDDPTTYVQQSMRRSLVAYKPMGLVDYVRFITDKQKTGQTFTLGAAKFPLIAGNGFTTDQNAKDAGVPGLVYSSGLLPAQPDSSTFHRHSPNTLYGPVRSNGGLQFQGEPMIVLNEEPDLTNYQLNQNPQRGDKLEVVGDIDSRTDNDLYLQAPDLPRLALSSKNPLLDKYVVKGVNRIEAPDITTEDPTARVPRYKLLTRFSSPLKPGYTTVQSDVAARNGLGAGIYIDNAADVQNETLAYSLTGDWMNPGGNDKWWKGNVYRPPGVRIQLLSNAVTLGPGSLVDGQTLPSGNPVTFPNGLIQIDRSDRTWRVPDPSNPNNADGKDAGTFRQYFQYPLLPNETAPVNAIPPTFSNGVIFTEGNVRLRGKLPKDRSNACFPGGVAGQRLTIVTNATAYIEGSLLKGDPNVSGQPQRSGLAVLAKDYVTVNPTSNFAVVEATNTGAWDRAEPGNFWAYTLGQTGDQFSLSVLNGVNSDDYPAEDNSDGLRYPKPPPDEGNLPGAASVKQALYTQMISESSSVGAGLKLQVNWNLTNPASPIAAFHPWWEVAPSGANTANRPTAHYVSAGDWNYEASPLNPMLGNGWTRDSSNPNFLKFSVAGNQPARIAKAAVVPLDVRIEAALYAMDGSFFIIPGTPLNGDSTDSRASFVQSGNDLRHGSMDRYLGYLASALSASGSTVTKEALARVYPYPFGNEPADIKITVVGSVAENRPASPEAQTEWAKLWGWTPLKKASGAVMAHGGDGLSFQFDPSLRAALRFDKYNRPLPLMPRLPVSPDMVFSGEAQ